MRSGSRSHRAQFFALFTHAPSYHSTHTRAFRDTHRRSTKQSLLDDSKEECHRATTKTQAKQAKQTAAAVASRTRSSRNDEDAEEEGEKALVAMLQPTLQERLARLESNCSVASDLPSLRSELLRQLLMLMRRRKGLQSHQLVRNSSSSAPVNRAASLEGLCRVDLLRGNESYDACQDVGYFNVRRRRRERSMTLRKQ